MPGKCKKPIEPEKDADQTPSLPQSVNGSHDLSPTQQAILWLLEGHRDHDVKEALAAKYHDQNPEQVLSMVMAHFEKISQADPAVIRGWCLEAYQELYRRMVGIGDYANALRAVKELYRVSS